MDFEDWWRQAWNRHADHPDEVAGQLAGEAAEAAASDAQLARLASLAHHVLGEHLGRWQDGLALLHSWHAHPHFAAQGESARSIRLYAASLQLSAGEAGATDALDAETRIRARALAAAALAPHDVPRALSLFQQALADAEAAALPDAGAHSRTLAVTGNNLACTLEEKAARSPDERALMILAAQTARRFWALAGGWLELERAEYRLAMTWLKAGDAAQARHHAQLCLETVQANGNVALERFFGWEALGTVERSAGNATGHAQALAQAREAFEALDEGDRGWCRTSLDQLAAA